MGILNYQNFCVFVAQEFKKITLPSEAERRIGVFEYSTDIMHYLQRDLNTVEGWISEERLTWEKAAKSITELVIETTSLLYAVGAEHIVWRHWSSLTAFGMFLQGKMIQAAQYAVLGGEWNFIQSLPPTPVKSQQISEQVFWMLVKGNFTAANLPESTSNEEDNAWLQLAQSIPAQDHRQTEEALKEITNFWMAEDEDDWMNFHPRSYPDFETPVCAVAALARHYSFTPTSLTPEQYSFLEAGLAIPEPLPMFPNIFYLPESSKASAV
jgi:hypothetical protein